jgi:hypothetical protein
MAHVHVFIFDDLTFIGVTSSQIIFDVIRTRTLLHAWTRLLSGEDISAIQGMERDVAPFKSFQGPAWVDGVRGYGDFDYFIFPLPPPFPGGQWVQSAAASGNRHAH